MVFGLLTALLLGACGLVVTGATARAAGRRPYDAALFALSPLLVFHAFSNWDLLAMALASGALWAWATRRPVLAGLLVGLGTAAKLYPALLLVPLWLLAVRTRRFGGAGWATAAAVGSWLAVNVPLALAYPHGWSEFYRFSIDRPAERSTVWAIGNTMVESTLSATDSTYWVPPGPAVALMFALGLLVVAALALLAPRKPRVGQLAFLVVLVFLLTTKVWSPQYSLWLVPLLALARPRWRLSLVWQFTEIAVWFVTLTLLLGLDPQASAHGVTYSTLVVVIAARDVLLLVIAALIVREMWHPELDVGPGRRRGRPGRRGVRRRLRRAQSLAQIRDVSALTLGAAGCLDHHVAACRAAHFGDELSLDLTGLDVGVPVGAGVECVAAVVRVHQVDPAGDRQRALDDARQFLTAGVRMAGVQHETGAELADQRPRAGRAGRSAGPSRCSRRRCSR